MRAHVGRLEALARRVLLLSMLPLAATAQQQNVPHIGYVYPAGARQEAALEVTVGGQFLNGASEAYISGSGVQASVVQYIRPMTPAVTIGTGTKSTGFRVFCMWTAA